jgi:hypothetical protein
MSGGWFGLAREVVSYLATVGADRADDGTFLTYVAPVSSGMGGDELVVPAETEYSVGGKRCNLAAGLNGTSYGVRGVAVF